MQKKKVHEDLDLDSGSEFQLEDSQVLTQVEQSLIDALSPEQSLRKLRRKAQRIRRRSAQASVNNNQNRSGVNQLSSCQPRINKVLSKQFEISDNQQTRINKGDMSSKSGKGEDANTSEKKDTGSQINRDDKDENNQSAVLSQEEEMEQNMEGNPAVMGDSKCYTDVCKTVQAGRCSPEGY